MMKLGSAIHKPGAGPAATLGLVVLLLMANEGCGSQARQADTVFGQEGLCRAGEAWCEEGLLKVCSPDGERISSVSCPDDSPCKAGSCQAACDPEVRSCENGISRSCLADGSGLILEDCSPGVCGNGYCMACYPGKVSCMDEETVGRCREDGSGLEVVQTCDSGTGKTECYLGQCLPVCAFDMKEPTNVGCEYWAMDLDNFDSQDPKKDAQNSPFAVIVSNPSTRLTAEVVVSSSDGEQSRQEVGPGELSILALPPRNADGSGILNRSWRIQSDVPLIAYQFNPLSNVDVFSNDASMLIPISSLGTSYRVMTRESGGEQHQGYFNVVATGEGTTHVSVQVSCPTTAGPSVPAMEAGEQQEFDLEQYQVLAVQSRNIGDDLTGSLITSDKPVAVFGGHECANVPHLSVCRDGKCKGSGFSCRKDLDCPSICCCDHLEEQLIPSEAAGTHYIAPRTWPRNNEKDYWRILALENDTKLTLTPPISPVTVLNAGQHVEFVARESFEIRSTKPVLVGQFLAGQNDPELNFSECMGGWLDNPEAGGVCKHDGATECTSHWDCMQYCSLPAECRALGQDGDAGTGDPSFMMLVPVERFRKDYVFLVPDKYAEDYLTMIVSSTRSVRFDGEPIPELDLEPVGSGAWRVVRTRITDGVHTLSADDPVGILIYGYDQYVSYAYPGGMTFGLLLDP